MSDAPQIGDGERVRNQKLRNIFVQLCSQASSVIESETLEIKNWCSNEKQLGEKVSEVAVCLANLRGGLILLGIENEDHKAKKFSQCPYRNVTTEWVTRRIQDNTVPPVDVSVVDASNLLKEITGQSDADCYAVLVAKSKHVGGHQTISGLSKIRSGKECRPYYVAAQDDRTKAPVSRATINDLSLGSVEWGMFQHQKKFNVSKESWEGTTDFLLKTGLIESSIFEGQQLPSYRISLAALLLFGKESSIAREFPSFETVVITPVDTKRLRTNIVETYRQICSSRNSLLPAMFPAVPLACIKELLVNAFVHRSYRHDSPIIVRATHTQLQIESPGPLCEGLTTDALLYCTPAYRNFLLAEGARYLGLCDKIGKGIDEVYKGVLQNGLGFPILESGENHFSAQISLEGCAEFREFIKRRAQALTQLDEIIILRFLFERETATFLELCAAMQRGHQFGHRVLSEMFGKNMIEPLSSLNLEWRLPPLVRTDIRNIFRQDQCDFGFGDLYGDS